MNAERLENKIVALSKIFREISEIGYREIQTEVELQNEYTGPDHGPIAEKKTRSVESLGAAIFEIINRAELGIDIAAAGEGDGDHARNP